MPEQPDDETMIRESFDKLRADFDTHSAFFYNALFRRAPELRALFREDLAGQGMKFMTTLDEIIRHLRTPEQLAERYSELGHTHSSLGVTRAHFEPMGEALIDTLRNALGDTFTPELEKAWRRAYADIAATMIGQGKIS